MVQIFMMAGRDFHDYRSRFSWQVEISMMKGRDFMMNDRDFHYRWKFFFSFPVLLEETRTRVEPKISSSCFWCSSKRIRWVESKNPLRNPGREITVGHRICSTHLAQSPTEKRFLLLNGRTMSVEKLFVVKPEESHENSIYLFIFVLKVIIQHR